MRSGKPEFRERPGTQAAVGVCVWQGWRGSIWCWRHNQALRRRCETEPWARISNAWEPGVAEWGRNPPPGARGAGAFTYDVRKDFRSAGCREGDMLIWREVETWKEREMRLAGRNMRGVTLGLTTPPRHGGGGSGSGRGWMMVLPMIGGRWEDGR